MILQVTTNILKKKEVEEECEAVDDIEAEEELEYLKHDPVAKYQFDYNKSTYFGNNFPELCVDELNIDSSNRNKPIKIAPGEGKIPFDIMSDPDWDKKTYPTLDPDGKNSLNVERKVKITHQMYFKQRLFNIRKSKICKFACIFVCCYLLQ